MNTVLEACGSGQFLCSDGVKCISGYKRCNWNNDCGDFSDEIDCSKYYHEIHYSKLHIILLSEKNGDCHISIKFELFLPEIIMVRLAKSLARLMYEYNYNYFIYLFENSSLNE